MSGFAVPLSSSPPATPDSRRRSFVSNPSTTPAGPPPPSHISFTPAGPPPPSVFSSSQLGLGSGSASGSGKLHSSPKYSKAKVLFAQSGVSKPQTGFEFGASSRTKNGTTTRPLHKRPGFSLPSSTPPGDTGSDGDDEDDSMADADVDDAPISGYATRITTNDTITSSLPDFTSSARTSSGLSPQNSKPRGTKRSRGGKNLRSEQTPPQRAKGTDSVITRIARDLAADFGPASVDEEGDVILTTEDYMIELYNHSPRSQVDDSELEVLLSTTSDELIRFWKGLDSGKFHGTGSLDGEVVGIGPGDRASPIAKATFLSSLLLQLHHPPPIKPSSYLSHSRTNRSSLVPYSSRSIISRPVTIPKLLLDWLNTFHDPYPNALIDLQANHPNSTSHPDFWDTIYSACLRGKIDEVIRILEEADFSYAKTAKDDGESEYGYRGMALKNIQTAVGWAIQVLQECPAVQVGDWDIRGSPWTIFRLRIAQAMEDLSSFAEDEGQDNSMADSFNSFSAENFGIRSLAGDGKSSLSQTARRVRSKVPWTIYQGLKDMYGIVIGGTTEILSFSQDWVEATIALTAWWDGEEEEDENHPRNSGPGKRHISTNNQPLSKPLDDRAAYLRKLASAFDRVTDITDEDAFKINTLSPIEVGLASVCEGDIEGVVGLLRSWSLVITSAFVEVASLGGWLGLSDGGDLMMGFDKSDLLVLSYGQSKKAMSRDDILVEYAEGLFRRDKLEGRQSRGSTGALGSQGGRAFREGWEIGVQVLGRLGDSALANKKLGDLLTILPLTSSERVDQLLDLCNKLNMARQAWSISEVG
jgi:Nup85 Nucleoporin